MSEDIAGLTLSQVADAIRDRKISSVEATQACLNQMARLGPVLDCLAEVDPESALAAAAEADAELAAGRSRGPLHGVPLAHKDMYYRAGRVSGCGSKIRADFKPTETSAVLERLDAAGALDIARLNMVEFALGVTGHNEVMPTPRNPWNTDYITGGSSSGPGSAVAGRLIYGAFGSDTGGSIRFPATCCGLVGMKPTYGRVSRRAAMALSHSLDTLGPMTRTVADNALLLRTTAGHDRRDATSSRLPVSDYMVGIEHGVAGLKIAVPENYFYDPVDGEVAALVRASLDVLTDAGAELVSVTIPDSITATNAMSSLITSTEGASLHQKWLQERPGDYGRQTHSRMSSGLYTPATRYLQALRLRPAILAEFAEAVFEDADVLHIPTMIDPVPTIAESDLAANPGYLDRITAMGHCTRPINYLGLPSLTLPCGFTANGLPMAFQLVGRPFDEATLYRAGHAYERDTEWTARAPKL